MGSTHVHAWRMFVTAMNQEAKPIIDHYNLLLVNQKTIHKFNNLDKKMFGYYFNNLSDKFHIYVNGHNFENVLIVTGLGKINAAAAMTYGLSIFNPSQVINIGLCGSLRESLKKGSIVTVCKVFQHDMYLPLKGLEFDSVSEIIDLKFKFNLENHYPFIYACLATGDSFVDNNHDKKHLMKLGADVVDMEAYALAKICQYHHVNLYVYKIISDESNSVAISDFNDMFEVEVYKKSIQALIPYL